MAVADGVRRRVRANPVAITAVLSAVGYAIVLGTFGGYIDIYPSLSNATVDRLGHLIAAINTTALACLLFGFRAIRRGRIRRHRAAMLSAFALILLFLIVYLLKIGGGFEKAILATGAIRLIYLAMLAVHVGLSILAVPVVIHAVVLGLSHTPAELSETVHPRVGRIAVGAWSLSLALGILTYVLLNWVYGWEPRHATAMLLVVAVPAVRFR